MKQYRQGDVFITQVKALPKDAQEAKAENKVILAYSEVTGHHHRFDDVLVTAQPKVRMWSAGAERFIQVMERSALIHEEHAAIPIEPGIYRVDIQREYSPEEIRRVAD